MRVIARIMVCVLLVGLLLNLNSSTSARQDDAVALLEMLAFLPDSPEVRNGLIDYAHFQAMFPLLAENTPIDNAESLLACLRDADCEYVGDWMLALPGLAQELFQPNMLLTPRQRRGEDCARDPETLRMDCGDPPVYDSMVDVMGFGPFDVTHTLMINARDLPPMMMVAGDFDVDAIDAAFSGRGYTMMDAPEGGTLWCVAEGCDETLSGPDTMDSANIFGGRIGAKRPAFLANGHLLSSVDMAHTQLYIDTYMGEQPALADAPDMQAAAEALDSIPGTFVQAVLIGSPASLTFNLDMIMAQMSALSSEEVSEEQIEAFVEHYNVAREDLLPAYDMVAIADYLDETGRQTVVALVFDDAEDAATAAERIPALMANYISFEWQRSLMELIDPRVDETAIQMYTSESTGKTVLLLQWWMHPPAADDMERMSTYQQGGLFFLLYRAVLSQDMGWLASGVISSGE